MCKQDCCTGSLLRKRDLLSYGWTRQVYTGEGGELPIPPLAFVVLATNIGTTLALVDGFPIHASLVPGGANGESHVIGGHWGMIIDMPGLEILFPNGPGSVFIRFGVYKKLEA
jgi:hypothetical protein